MRTQRTSGSPGTIAGGLRMNVAFGVAGIVLLILLLIPGPGYSRKGKAARIACVGRLKNVGLSLRIFSTDHQGKWPWQVSTNQGGTQEHVGDPSSAWTHFHAISNALSTPAILRCPALRGRPKPETWAPTNAISSYFLGLDASEEDPSTLLSGDSNLELDGRSLRTEIIVVRTYPTPRFDQTRHEESGNILLGDGSVQQVTSFRLQEATRDQSGNRTNRTYRWLIP